jgi:lipopolysaccharide export system protein LptA
MRIPWLLLLALSLPTAAEAADDPFQFRGDRLTSSFAEGQERTTLTGHARIVSGNLEIQADLIELWGKAFRFASCTGSVTVHDTKKNLVLRADTMEYDRTLKTSRFRGLGQMDDADHGVTVRAGLFDYDETAEKLVIQLGVRIFKGDLVCRSEFAVYDRAADTLELTGLPTVNKKQDVYRAGIIRVNIKTEDVFLEGRVSGTISPDKKKDDKPVTNPPLGPKP